jgi:hypothetical protein
MTKASAAVVRDYDELRHAVAARWRALGPKQFEVNFRVDLQDGYVNKIECGIRHFCAIAWALRGMSPQPAASAQILSLA